VFIFVNFSFALFTPPPLGDYQRRRWWIGGAQIAPPPWFCCECVPDDQAELLDSTPGTRQWCSHMVTISFLMEIRLDNTAAPRQFTGCRKPKRKRREEKRKEAAAIRPIWAQGRSRRGAMELRVFERTRPSRRGCWGSYDSGPHSSETRARKIQAVERAPHIRVAARVGVLGCERGEGLNGPDF
jgi:hypothetical protein